MTLQEKLYALFLLDQQVRGLRSRADAAASRLRAQQTKLQRLMQQREELAAQLKQTQAAARTLETQSQAVEEKIKRLREQMNAVKSNKEYSALLVEVNTLKADRVKIDDEALEQLTRVDQLKAEMAELDARVVDQEKLVAAAQREVTEAHAEVADRLNAVTAERNAAYAELPAEAQQLFDKTSQVHEGETLAEVVEESRKHMEYTCGGCYISIPIERVSTLMSRPEIIVTCPNCGRILYLNAELKSALSGA